MATLSELDVAIIAISLEAFFYGLYAGIFALYYLHCSVSKKSSSTTAGILFYALWLLFILSTIDFVADLLVILVFEFEMNFSSILRIDVKSMMFSLTIIETIASGCSDFLAQCILIYRCWIVWNQNIHVVTIPSFLAIAYLASWLAPIGELSFEDGDFFTIAWGIPVTLTSFALSMTVNTLVTGLIVFRILKVFWQVRPTSVERCMGSTGGTTLRHVIFVLIESGTALFVIQLIRVVLAFLPAQSEQGINGSNFVIGINEMFNGITPTIILLRVLLQLSFEDKESFMEVAESICFNHNPPSDLDTSLPMGDSSSITAQDSERNKDIYLNDPPSESLGGSDHDTLRRLGSSSSIQPQEKSEDT